MHIILARTAIAAAAAAAGLAVPVAAAAQPVPWVSHTMREAQPTMLANRSSLRDRRDSREGKVTAEQFAAEDGAAVLGHGAITVRSVADSTPEARDRLVYEAAMIDRLVMAGYDTMAPTNEADQLAEIRVISDIAEPAEVERNPVSGSTAVTVSNRGTAMGMALNVDMTNPRAALLSTRMELRIRDRESGRVLWEARAQTWSRDDPENRDEGAIANRLAAALMEGFPRPAA